MDSYAPEELCSFMGRYEGCVVNIWLNTFTNLCRAGGIAPLEHVAHADRQLLVRGTDREDRILEAGRPHADLRIA